MLWLFKTNFVDFVCFLSMVTQVTYVVLYTQCLRYNICSVWFLDIRISTCYQFKLILSCEEVSRELIR